MRKSLLVALLLVGAAPAWSASATEPIPPDEMIAIAIARR